MGPSGNLMQNWRFYVVTDRTEIEKLSDLWSQIYERVRHRGGEMPEKLLESCQYMIEHFRRVPAVVLAGATNFPGREANHVLTTTWYASILPSVQNLMLAARAGTGNHAHHVAARRTRRCPRHRWRRRRRHLGCLHPNWLSERQIRSTGPQSHRCRGVAKRPASPTTSDHVQRACAARTDRARRDARVTVTKAVLAVFTNVTSPEHDEACNDWYDDTHLADVLTLTGYTASHPLPGIRRPGEGHGAGASLLVDLRGRER
jgi:hypothetical protein